MNSTGWTDRRVWMAAMAMALGAGVAAAADVTLSANAWINSNGQLTNNAQGVLLTATGGTGTTNNPYLFDIAGNLNLGSNTIVGNTNNTLNQYSATWRVTGNVTGTGNFDSYADSNTKYGGNVRVEAGGTIALNRIVTRAKYNADAGAVFLWATGTVTVASHIDTRTGGGSSVPGSVTIRSEGPVSGQGISIQGTTNGDGSTTNSILTEARYGGYNCGAGGAVGLYCETNITLAGGIATRGFPSGAVVIRGSLTAASARAGTVTIGAGIRTDPREYTNKGAGGNVTIRAIALRVADRIDAHADVYYNRSGSVDIDVLENATILGYVDTRLTGASGFTFGSPGYVKIKGRRISVLGTDAGGYSIRTWPGALSNPGSSGSIAGDADVTLTNVDTSAEIYDPANPTNSMTSSIYVAGKIEAGRWYNDNAMGNIRISAVEVQLGGDVTNSSSTSSSIMSIRYGTNAYGIVTHLVENGMRWNGVASHNITYYMASGTKTFLGDVPYAGKLVTAVAATIFNRPATNITTTGATFRGYLSSAGDPAAAVSVRWGATSGVYDHTNSWNAGDWSDSSYPSTNLSLSANQDFYYTFVATNAGGTAVADPPVYFITGALGAQATEGTCGTDSSDTGIITITRPDTCTNGALTVNYALSGATSYVNLSPASGFLMAAGQASASITVQPVVVNSGAPMDLVLTLLPGAYPSAALAAATCTVATASAPDVTLSGDAFIDAADGGKLKYLSGGPVIAVPWAGTTRDGETYSYTYPFHDLNLGGYSIHGATNHSQSQASALFETSGSVSGGGSFLFHTEVAYIMAGNLRIEAAGSIALSNVWTYVYYGENGSASTYLWAKGGPAALTGSIRAEADPSRAKTVIVRSDGPVGSRGIAIAGGNSGFSIRTYNDGRNSGAPVWLCTEGDITLGGDLIATGSGGDVTVRGNYTNAALRAGSVVVRGNIPTWVLTSYNAGDGSGDIVVLATNLVVDGSLQTYCKSYQQRGGRIQVDVTGDARFGGYLDAHTEWDGYGVSSPGPVYILARHTAINGTNANGCSITTRPTTNSSSSWWASQPGDGNITLTNVDTSAFRYNPEKPLQGDTSSLSISGKVEAAYCGTANIQGDILLSAVEVQLGNSITTSNAPSDIVVHYGVTTHGVVTHLVENGARWDGSSGHNVSYGLAAPVFFADVPYAGVLHPQGTMLLIW